MESAIVLNADDVRKIIADKFRVNEKQVIKSQYSYTVVGVTCDAVMEFQGEIKK